MTLWQWHIKHVHRFYTDAVHHARSAGGYPGGFVYLAPPCRFWTIGCQLQACCQMWCMSAWRPLPQRLVSIGLWFLVWLGHLRCEPEKRDYELGNVWRMDVCDPTLNHTVTATHLVSISQAMLNSLIYISPRAAEVHWENKDPWRITLTSHQWRAGWPYADWWRWHKLMYWMAGLT